MYYTKYIGVVFLGRLVLLLFSHKLTLYIMKIKIKINKNVVSSTFVQISPST